MDIIFKFLYYLHMVTYIIIIFIIIYFYFYFTIIIYIIVIVYLSMISTIHVNLYQLNVNYPVMDIIFI